MHGIQLGGQTATAKGHGGCLEHRAAAVRYEEWFVQLRRRDVFALPSKDTKVEGGTSQWCKVS